MGRARARPSRQGNCLRGGRLRAAGDDRDEHLRPRRSQHASLGAGRRRAPEGGVAAPACIWRDPLVLYDDRARADPSMLLTTSRRDGDDFVIDGDKWLITGAVGARLAIIMARNADDALG